MARVRAMYHLKWVGDAPGVRPTMQAVMPVGVGGHVLGAGAVPMSCVGYQKAPVAVCVDYQKAPVAVCDASL